MMRKNYELCLSVLNGEWIIIDLVYRRGRRFLDFLDLQFSTTIFRSAKEFKTKAEKEFFFIFMSSYAEMSMWGPKKRKSH
jgi:hypothetical protein